MLPVHRLATLVAGGALFVGVAGAMFLVRNADQLLTNKSTWHALGRSLSAAHHDLPALRASLARTLAESDEEAVLAGALCDASAAALEGKPPSVGDVISDTLQRAVIGRSLTGELQTFEAGLKLGEWNQAAAARYVQACSGLAQPAR
jgi:hypothetical protein